MYTCSRCHQASLLAQPCANPAEVLCCEAAGGGVRRVDGAAMRHLTGEKKAHRDRHVVTAEGCNLLEVPVTPFEESFKWTA